MKMLYSGLLILCLARAVNMQAAGQNCGANDACDVNLVCQDEKCRLKADQTCTATAHCIANSNCIGNPNTCTCKDGFVANSDKTMCMRKVGLTCAANDDDCVDGSKCMSQKCTCKTNYLAVYDMTSCRKAPGESCGGSNGPCGDNAVCTANKCVCKDGFASREGERCGKKVGEACSETRECVMNADCRVAGNPSACQCMDNYQATSDRFCSPE